MILARIVYALLVGNAASFGLKGQSASLPMKVQLGLDMVVGGDVDGAAACLFKATQENPESWDAHWYLGKTLSLIRDKSDSTRSTAKHAFLTSMTLRPERMPFDCTLATGDQINTVFSNLDQGADDIKLVRSTFRKAVFDASSVRRKFGLSGSEASSFGVGVMMHAKRLAGCPDSNILGLPTYSHSQASSKAVKSQLESFLVS